METGQQQFLNNGISTNQMCQVNQNSCIIREYPNRATPKFTNAFEKFLPSSNSEPIDLTRDRGNLSRIILPYKNNKNLCFSNQAHNTRPQDIPDREILSAAKSLFSKRTGTLYHWMYPDVPKTQLKAAVASSWEKLLPSEKEFYVSQVLGRYGFSEKNVIINPQLDGINKTQIFPPLNLLTQNKENFEETGRAVTNLIYCEETQRQENSWIMENNFRKRNTRASQKKRKRSGRPLGSKNKTKPERKSQVCKQLKDDDLFQNDPELYREFEQFKWFMNLNN